MFGSQAYAWENIGTGISSVEKISTNPTLYVDCVVNFPACSLWLERTVLGDLNRKDYGFLVCIRSP